MRMLLEMLMVITYINAVAANAIIANFACGGASGAHPDTTTGDAVAHPDASDASFPAIVRIPGI